MSDEQATRRSRRSGISRTGARAAAIATGYVALMFAIGTPLVVSRRALVTGTAVTLAELCFLIAIPAAVGAFLLTRHKPWRPALAIALTGLPLPAGLICLILYNAT